ncbi:DUF58 domain-containing protein [Oceaniserpentilla sp. 4NH20-0058]|uniref:DUF58 domain-containing protein n=1 Tax=Oceaniserpentilla sp. 4NH20-0058 TaxID=3127660 RepID=UPI0031096C36
MFELKDKFNLIYQNWLNRRLPTSSEIQLTQKKIFILPNKVGWMFLLMLILIFVTGINYQNNLILTIGFILISVFITSIIATYQNLSSLIIKAKPTEPVFLGEMVNLPITLINPSKNSKYGILTGYNAKSLLSIDEIKEVAHLNIPFKPNKRGTLITPRMKLFTVYPLGFISCWTWLRLDYKGVVYPKPLDKPFRRMKGDGYEDDAQLTEIKGVDEYQGLRKYQKGDSLKQVAWKQYAKTQQLLTKEYQDVKGDDRILDWYSLDGYDLEQRLQILCGWILKADLQQSEYSLRLPNQVIAISSGKKHKYNCLNALAMYPGGLNG